MALSDAQIDRFSRQIILPQIGGGGQERLLQSSVALAGDSALVEIVALSLAGAGVGWITLHGNHRLIEAIRDLNPDVQITPASGVLGSVDANVLLACDVTLAEMDRVGAAGRPLVAGGIIPGGGWFVVADRPEICVGCATRHAGEYGVRELAPALGWDGGVGSRPAPTPKRRQAAALHSVSPAAGIIGSLMSLAVVKLRLGLGGAIAETWLQFDADTLTLTAHPLTRAPDCPACGGRAPA